eukprot:gene12124-biopygen3895
MSTFSGKDLDWDAKGAVTPVRKQDTHSCAGDCGLYSAVQDVESSYFMAGWIVNSSHS